IVTFPGGLSVLSTPTPAIYLYYTNSAGSIAGSKTTPAYTLSGDGNKMYIGGLTPPLTGYPLIEIDNMALSGNNNTITHLVMQAVPIQAPVINSFAVEGYLTLNFTSIDPEGNLSQITYSNASPIWTMSYLMAGS